MNDIADVSAIESLTSKAYTQLRDDIIAGTLEPGRKLKVDELRRTYGIGASPIREALSLLTSDRLVDRIEQRGFRVSHVSREEFLDLLRVRSWLEERALRESIALGDADWEDRVLTTHFRLSRLPRSRDETRFEENTSWEELHKTFHLALISGCGSLITLRICDQLYDQNVRYRRIAGPQAYPARNVKDEHSALANAALDRDADRAARLLVEHYEVTASYLADRLDDLGGKD